MTLPNSRQPGAGSFCPEVTAHTPEKERPAGEAGPKDFPFINYSTVRSQRGIGRKTAEQIDACLKILGEIQPATVRAVCYRMFVAGRISRMAKNETNKVSRLLTTAREKGLIPWDWIVDETREAEHAATWRSPAQIVAAAVRTYRRDHWQAQPCWLEVWSEKGTVRGTLAPVLNEYGVTFRVMHGYGSATALHDVAELTASAEKPLTALYVGDHDCSGMHMSEVDIPGRLTRYDGSAQIARIALTADDTPSLPAFAAKPTDPRYGWYLERYGGQCWELDALSPVILRNRVEAAILAHIDLDAWQQGLLVESAEIESLRRFHDAWRDSQGR